MMNVVLNFIEFKDILRFLYLSITFIIPLSGCTVLRYEAEPHAKEVGLALDNQKKVSVQIISDETDKSSRSTKELNYYEKTSLDILSMHGICNVSIIDNFHVDDPQLIQASIIIKGEGGALPQEYLTGFSFGLIPSWGIREGRIRYEFDYYKNGKRIKESAYEVDEKSFSWIVVSPFFWVNFITYNETYEIYKQSLSSFLFGNNMPPLAITASEQCKKN